MNWLLILGPPTGVLLIVLVVAATGGMRRARLDASLACRRAAEDVPGFVAGDCLIDGDGASALVADRSGSAVAVAYAMGARVVVRKIGKGDLRSWRIEPQGLVLDVADFTHPHFRIALTDGLAEPWRLRLSALGSAGVPA